MSRKRIGPLLLSVFLSLSIPFVTNADDLFQQILEEGGAEELQADFDQGAVMAFERYLERRTEFTLSLEDQKSSLGPDEVINPRSPDDIFNPPDGGGGFPDPSDDFSTPYYPGFSSRSTGAAYLVAMEVLYQTLMYFGVTHVLERKGTRVNFKIIHSKNGYFQSIGKSEVSFALREFSRYLVAHMCGKATPENFYQMLAQVPAEEIGLRFKYDMAWALLGNGLPKDANEIYAMGQNWKALRAILNTGMLPKEGQEAKDIKSLVNVLTDVVNFTTQLNKLTCYVDIRPKPKQELKKRILIKKLLNMERDLLRRYKKFQEIADAMEEAAKQEQKESLEDFIKNEVEEVDRQL